MPLPASTVLPPLREGDRLSSDEFMRRWDAMPDLNYAELIEGVVYMPSPVFNVHGVYHFRISSWLAFYLVATPGCEATNQATCLMSEGNIPQPDLALRISSEYGGQSKVKDGYANGAPELAVEISVTTAAKDSGVKLRMYEREGVREYLMVQPKKRKVIWRELVDGEFREIQPDADGLLKSRVFPGLWLDPSVVWNDDISGLAAAVQRGSDTAEHAAFVETLRDRKK